MTVSFNLQEYESLRLWFTGT